MIQLQCRNIYKMFFVIKEVRVISLPITGIFFANSKNKGNKSLDWFLALAQGNENKMKGVNT